MKEEIKDLAFDLLTTTVAHLFVSLCYGVCLAIILGTANYLLGWIK